MRMRGGLAVLVVTAGCFNYGGGGGGGAGGVAGGVTITRTENRSSSDPHWVVSGPEAQVEIFMTTASTHDRVTWRPRKGSAVTTYFATSGSDGELGSPRLIHDEGSGLTVVIKTVSATRVEFHHHDAMGRWLSALVLFQDGAAIKQGRLTGTPAFSGQLQGQLRGGSSTGSFAVVGTAASTLTDVIDVTSFIDALSTAAGLGSSQQPLVAVKQQPVFSLARKLIVAGVVIAVGGVAAASAGVAIGGAYAAAGVATALCGFFANDVANFIENKFASEDPLAQSLANIAVEALRDPEAPSYGGMLTKMADVVRSVAATGEAVAGGARDAVRAVTTNDWSSAPWSSAPDTPIPSTYDAPPSTPTTVSGQAVWQDNSTEDITGTVDSMGNLSLTSSDATDPLSATGTVMGTMASGTFMGNGQSGTFTAQVTPISACMVSQSSGGQGTFTNVHTVGADAGTVQFSYDAFSIPDAFTVRQDGRTLFSTGGLVSGQRTVTVQSSGGFVFVSVSAPQSGTAWNYQIGCAQ